MNNFIFAVLAYMKELEDEKKSLLLCEENGNKIAEAQGIVAGIGLLRGKICKHFAISRDTAEDHSGKYPSWPSLQTPSLYTFQAELVLTRGTDEYAELVKAIEAENQFKKDWLWMRAEKGRDLIYVKGWKTGMQALDTVIEALETAYTKRKQELQFDAEKKADKEYQPSLISELAAAAAEQPEPSDIDAEWDGDEEYDEDGTPPEVDGDQPTPVF